MVSDISLTMHVLSSVSILACISILVTPLWFPHLRDKISIKYSIYIAASNLISAVGSSLGSVPTGSIECWFQGFITNIFTLSSIFWTTFVTRTLYIIVIGGKYEYISWWQHVTCWVLPVIVSTLPLINATYGK
jgi:hypothetical protein